MSATTVPEKTREIVDRVASSEGLEVVDIEWKGGGNNRLLRIFIDKPGGVTHADCEAVSRQVSVILDVEDVIETRYTLEVSSPGLDRKLVKAADYERFAGRKARVMLQNPIAGQRNFVGRLAGLAGDQVSIEVGGGRRVEFPLEDVKAARLVVEF